MKKLLLLACTCCSIALSFGQGTWVVSNMDWVPSSTDEFPQCRPQGRGHVVLPSPNIRYATNWLQPAQWLQTEGQQTTLNFVALQSSLKDENQNRADFQLPVFGFGMAFGERLQYAVNFEVEERVHLDIALPGDLLRLPLEGNLGLGVVDGDGLAFDFAHYRNVRIGIQGPLGDRMAWGMRLRQISGFERAALHDVSFRWETDPVTAAWKLEAGGMLETSGIGELLDTVGGQSLSFNKLKSHLTAPGSKGWGGDVGFRFLPNERWILDAGWSGFGRILWEHDLIGMQWQPDPIEFHGVDVLEGSVDPQSVEDSLRHWLNGWEETLEGASELDELSAPFVQTIPGTWAIRGRRALGPHASVQATGRRTGSGTWTLSSGTTIQLGRVAQLNATFTLGSSIRAAGVGAAFRGGPLLCFVALDNVLAARYVEVTWGEDQRAWLPWDASILHARLGMNWTIGRPKKPRAPLALPASAPNTRTPDWQRQSRGVGSGFGQ